MVFTTGYTTHKGGGRQSGILPCLCFPESALNEKGVNKRVGIAGLPCRMARRRADLPQDARNYAAMTSFTAAKTKRNTVAETVASACILELVLVWIRC